MRGGVHEDVPPPPSVPAATTHSGQQRVLQEREQILEEEAEDGHLHVGFFCGRGVLPHSKNMRGRFMEGSGMSLDVWFVYMCPAIGG